MRTRMLINAPLISNDQSIDRLLAAQVPVMLLFWDGGRLAAEVDQTLLRLADQEAGELIIAKINTRENPGTVRRFNVEHTPLLVSTRGGSELARAARPSPGDLEAHAQFALGRAERPTASAASEKERADAAPGRVQAHPVAVTDAAFEQMVLRSPLPVLVDFWAPWCGPCHSIAPVLDRFAREYAGRLRVAKVNVDESTHYASVYGVQGIPTLLMIRNGQVIDRLVGVQPENYLRAKVERYLLNH